jgi:putative nucleotidyltransferase with HDIG domain
MKLFHALGSKRYETMQHCTRVAAYATLFGETVGLSKGDLRDLQLGALLHDLGKVAIPRNVLLKPAALNEREWSIMRSHPRIGFELLAGVPGLADAAQIVYSHHEQFDGSGYPRALRGLEIPAGARMFSIIDTFDAVTCNRPYRAARSHTAAANEIRNGSQTQFDPELVDLFLTIPSDNLLEVRNRFPEVE